jgi:hypothetical protein
MKKQQQTQELLIEKDIPIPSKRIPITRVLGQMEAGDSVEISKSFSFSWYATAIRLGMKISARRQGPGRLRIWRIS